MSTIAKPGIAQALCKLIAAALCALCLLLLCSCAGKSGDEGVTDQAIKYANSRVMLDLAESSVVSNLPDAQVEVSLVGFEEAPDGTKVIELEPCVVSDTMASWTEDEWAENRDDLFFNLAAHFNIICKQANDYGDVPDNYTVTCPDYMVVYDSKKSTGFIVTSTGVYQKTDDPENPIGKPIVTTDQGSAEQSSPTLADRPVSRDTSFGGVYVGATIDEFNELGFEYGDSVDIVFSNGYEMRGVPYYNGYYVRVGSPLLVGYPGYPYIEAAVNYGDPLWDTAGLSESDTATVTLAQAGAFADVQESFDIAYTSERSDYGSDVQFANFRSLSGGSMREGAAYRSASPVDNEYNRAAYVEDLMRQAGVAYVLDLSDDADEVDAFMAESTEQGVDLSYFKSLRDAGNVGELNLSASYPSRSFTEKLAAGLAEMSQHDGPYLIHCIEGKDRTGFVCALLEALCGATYSEMEADYMTTFANYYGITKESDPTKYNAILHLNLDGMLSFLAGVDDSADLGSIDYREPARNYLKSGGMTDEQIDKLIERLS
ncbi:MAG: tyrosine-protein phosphatase [Eggerthellaceae bacterium]|nr:tyrosine-protein phosphatase [Eggerthellaceae bacterium]